MDIRQPNPTQAAGILRKFLAESGIELKHTAALEAMARMSGFTDWQAMAADQKARADEPRLLQRDPKGDDNSDFVYLDNPGNRGVWVGVGSISVCIKPTDEGVVVDLFGRGAEDRGSEASTYVFYQEALDALCENNEVDLDDVSAWTKLEHDADFDKQPWSRKTELVQMFYQVRPAKGGANVAEVAATADDEAPAPAEAVSAEKRYLHGEWEHIFRHSPERTRLVFDRQVNAIIYLEVRNKNQWQSANHTDIADVQDSLLNANDEALEDPESYGLDESDTLPLWALAPVRY